MRRVPLSLVGVGAAVAAARLAVLVIRVDGASMAPTLWPGDRVLTLRRTVRRTVRRGDVVVCRRPAQLPGPNPYLIKRVVAVAGDRVPGGGTVSTGRVYVCGDGEGSLDSRVFGAIPVEHVVGRVVARLAASRA